MRRLLSTTILGGTLAFTAIAGVQNASAGSFYDLSPNSNWAVTTIRPKTASGAPYCALARRFTNDVVLTFARNQSNQTSIAIDFQKDRLNSNQFYNVRLDAGNGATREFNMKPVSAAAMVVKVGDDRAFMNALSRSGILKADIEGYQYSFNISDFSDGESRMGGCIAQLVEPAAGGFDEPIGGSNSNNDYNASPLTPVADTKDLLSAPSTDSGYASKISNSEADMSRQIDNLKADNDKLRAALAKQRQDFENQYMSKSKDSSAMIELSEKIQLLEVENNELRNKVTDMAVSQAKGAEMPTKTAQCEPKIVKDPAMAKQLEALRDANSKLALELKQAKANMAASATAVAQTGSADKQVISDLNNRVSNLEQENSTLKAQLNSAMQTQAGQSENGAKIASLQSSIDTLKMQNTRLQTKIQQQQVEMAKFDNHGQTQAMVSSLQERVDTLMNENTKLSKTIENLNSDGNAAASGTPFLASKVNLLETQLSDVKRERDDLLSKIDDMNKGREDKLIDISSDNWNLEKATRRYNEAEREIQRLGVQLEQERSSCNTQKHDIEYMLFDPSIATKEQIARLNKAEDKAARAEMLMDSQKVGYETKISSLQQKLSSLQGDIKVLQGKLQVAETQYQKGLADYKNQMASRDAKKNEEIASYQAKIKSMQSNLGTQIASLQDELKAKQDELAGKQAELVARNETIESLKADQEKIVTANADIEKLKRDKEFLVKKAAKLEQDNARLSQSVKEAEQKVASLEGVQQKLASLQSKIQSPVEKSAAATPVAATMEAAERMNVIEAAAGGKDQASGRIERESLPSPLAKGRDIGNVAVNTKPASVSARTLEQATKAGMNVASVNSGMTGIKKYLDMAGIKADKGVKKTDEKKNFVAYSWETQGMYGSAEQAMMGDRGYDDMVHDYLAKTEARCSGDFAASPASDANVRGIHVGSYEIACIGDDISASASIVFIEEHGQFTTIAHEAGLDYMDYAMDIRDKIVSSFDKTKMASR